MSQQYAKILDGKIVQVADADLDWVSAQPGFWERIDHLNPRPGRGWIRNGFEDYSPPTPTAEPPTEESDMILPGLVYSRMTDEKQILLENATTDDAKVFKRLISGAAPVDKARLRARIAAHFTSEELDELFKD